MAFDGTADRAGEQPSELRRQYTFKGVEPRAVELARAAARKEGMKVGAWVSMRLREAADRALDGIDSDPAEQLSKLNEHIQRIEVNQLDEKDKLGRIQDELVEIVRAQRTIMAKLLHSG